MFSGCFFPQCINPGARSKRRKERAKQLLAPPTITSIRTDSQSSLTFKTPTEVINYHSNSSQQQPQHLAVTASQRFITATSFEADEFYSCDKVLPSSVFYQDGDSMDDGTGLIPVEEDGDEVELFSSPPQSVNNKHGVCNGHVTHQDHQQVPERPTILVNGHNVDDGADNQLTNGSVQGNGVGETLEVDNGTINVLENIPLNSSKVKLANVSHNLKALDRDPNFVTNAVSTVSPKNSKPVAEEKKLPVAVDASQLKFSRDSSGSLVELGRGTYGQVLLGVYRQYSSAIKVFISPQVTHSDVYREANALKHLQGTGVVPKFFGVLHPSDNGALQTEVPALVMERISSSVTFYSLICTAASAAVSGSQKGDGPSRAQWLHIAVQLAAAVELLHRRNVLYNDLKMDNILVQMRARGYRVYLADLGDASGRHGLLYDINLAEINGKKNAYSHLAPEVLMRKPTSFASDVYSLGVALVYLMRVSGTADRLRSIIRLCLAVDPEDRPSAYLIRLKLADVLAKDAV